MRKFRFIGASWDWGWENNPVNGGVYTLSDLNIMRGGDPLDYYDLDPESGNWAKENWQEVFDTEPKTLHKDTDLGYYAGVAMQSQSNAVNFYLERYGSDWINEFTENSIILAKELIKQLNEENK